uniref:Uncharacterized protein n=1 Tax=Caenorhabditis japonica TaxID=281687 RepID=A0A8R1EJV6_CAEJA
MLSKQHKEKCENKEEISNFCSALFPNVLAASVPVLVNPFVGRGEWRKKDAQVRIYVCTDLGNGRVLKCQHLHVFS